MNSENPTIVIDSYEEAIAPGYVVMTVRDNQVKVDSKIPTDPTAAHSMLLNLRLIAVQLEMRAGGAS